MLNTNIFPYLNSEVFIPSDNLLKTITGINSKYKIHIGNLENYNSIDVFANPNLLFTKHLGIFGNTGSGKSRTIASLLESLKTRVFDYANNRVDLKPKIIVIDPYNEYKEILDEKKFYSINTDEGALLLSLPWNSGNSKISYEEFSGLISSSTTGKLYIKKHFNSGKNISLESVHKCLSDEPNTEHKKMWF